MHPILIKFFGLPVTTYGVLMAVAFTAVLKICLDRAKKTGMDREVVLNVFLIIFAGSMIGARGLYVVENADFFKQYPKEIVMVNHGGLSYFGGFGFALAVVAIYIHKLKKEFLQFADLFMRALPLGQAIGRIGCYCTGCCYGIIHEGIWGVVFPRGSTVFADQVSSRWLPSFSRFSLPVIPTQLLSSFLDVLLFCVLIVVDDRKKVPGVTFFSYLVGYGILRFCVEFLRGDSPLLPLFHLGWTLYQFIAVGIVFAGLAGLVVLLHGMKDMRRESGSG